MRILFVHGTGVRRERHDAVFETIRRELSAQFPGAAIEPCYWGDAYGASLNNGGRSIPSSTGVRGAYDDYAASPLDAEAGEWLLLFADPLCELRVLAQAGGEDAGLIMPGVQASGELVGEQLDAFAADPAAEGELTTLLRDTGLLEHRQAALRLVARSEEFAAACSTAADPTAAAEVAEAAARAVVAAMLAAAGADALCLGDERDRAVDILTARLGGTGRFPGGRAAAVLGRLALRVSTQPVLNHWRGSITGMSTPTLGDILRYQARGGPLRAFLNERTGAASERTVVIGHSLGGIALVDLLAMSAAEGRPLTHVALLVTVGSQAPLLHEIGALTGLAPGSSLPDGFPPWLNVFDRHDLLAFLAEPVFPDCPDVTDFEVASRQPFPVSHGAYWKSKALYQRIAQAVGALA